MNDTGPDAMVPVLVALVPRGRKVEKSSPMPPPCCIVTALSCKAFKNPGNRVFNRSHYEAIEKRHVSRRSGTGLDAAARQELIALQDPEKPRLPTSGIVGLDSRERERNPTPAVRDGAFVRVPILGFPDVAGNIGHGLVHR
jgi:hypothetical protein